MGLRAARMQRVRLALRQEALRRFEARGYEAVTVDAIAEAVGVSRRTIFRYFGGKDGLVFDGARQRLDAFQQSLAGALMGLSRATIRRWCEGGCQSDLVSDGVRALALISPTP